MANNSQSDFTSSVVTALENEHNQIFERTRSIDTRASILISILLAILPFYFEILNWQYIKTCLTTKCINFKGVFMLLLLFTSFLILLASLILCVIVICSRKYETFPAINYCEFDLKSYEDLKVTQNEMNVSIIDSYTKCIINNTPIIIKKAKLFIAAIFTTCCYVICVIATTLCNLL